MARYPGATWRPITANLGGPLTRYDCAILHVDAGGAASLFGQFNNPDANASAHFYVTYSGKVEQYADTNRQTWTSGAARSRSIGIETQGLGPGKWTDAQVKALAQLLVWLHKTHGIPLVLMPNSRLSAKGIGCHRYGVDGNFPALPSPQAGRIQRGGGELWSSSRGKECPGNARVLQIPTIIAMAKTLLGGAVEPKPQVQPASENPLHLLLDDAHRGKLQSTLGVKVDRQVGPDTSGALQKALGTPIDRVISNPSTAIRGLQTFLNAKLGTDLRADGSFGIVTAAVLTYYLDRSGNFNGAVAYLDSKGF